MTTSQVISRLVKTRDEWVKKHFIHLPTSTAHTILLSAMGRSGSTWIASLINFSNTHRDIFEPFLPIRVAESNVFEYTQYLNPQVDDPRYIEAAKNILEGRLKRQTWLDSGNTKLISYKRLIKDIRTNLMLGWFHQKFPAMKIILLIRNPFSVVQSFMDLGWGVEPCGTRREINILLGQKELLRDYPIIEQSLTKIDVEDTFEALMFQWCIMNYVPLKQLPDTSIHLTFYENYMLNPHLEIERVYDFINQKLDPRIFYTLKQPSRTSYAKREFSIDNIRFSSAQIERGHQILDIFGLSDIYDRNLHPRYPHVNS